MDERQQKILVKRLSEVQLQLEKLLIEIHSIKTQLIFVPVKASASTPDESDDDDVEDINDMTRNAMK